MKIVINGMSGEGKTTVACVVYDALKAAGFEVTKLDDPDLPLADNGMVQRRVESLTSEPYPTKIEIETRHIRPPARAC